jgi:hypothetical protein
MRKYTTGGKKPVKKSAKYTDEYGKPESAKAAAARDKRLTESIGQYGGIDYIRKQMGSEPKAAPAKKSLPTSTRAVASSTYVKKPIVKKKMKKGGSFDLNKDGKTTFKDVLIGRGVLPKTAKHGASKKKAMGGMSMSKLANMKKGGKTAKCKYGCK